MAYLITSFLINFIIISVSIFLFFLPFAGLFWYRHRVQIREKHPHFNYFMEQFFRSKESNFLVLTWAAAEALIWFVIPEYLLILIMFMKVNRKAELIKFDVLGTIIGTIIALLIHMPEKALLAVPYIYSGMLSHVHQWYSQHGIFGIFFQPFSGVPYKVFTSLASDYHFFIPFFIILAVIARMCRYYIIYEVTRALYPFVHRFVRKHYAILFVTSIAIFTILLIKVSLAYK